MERLTDKELAELVNRLDPIAIAKHAEDVAHISLVGYPEDVFRLDDYLMQKEKRKPSGLSPLTEEEVNVMMSSSEFNGSWAEIELRFGWERVHLTMTALNWKWSGSSVPSVEQLKESARALLYRASTDEHSLYMSGGFEAICKNGRLQLRFVLEKWHEED